MHLAEIFAICVVIAKIASSDGNPNLITNQITYILQKWFSSCEIIFVSVQYHNLSVSSTNFLPYNYIVSAGNYVAQSKSDDDKVVSFQRLKDVHKYNSYQCGVALIYADKTTKSLPKWLFKTVTPRYVPIIRKDEDHFLFVFNNEADAEYALTSYDFGQKIKLKLGLVYRGEEIASLYRTVNLYKNNGQPVVMSVPVNPETSDLSSLFPDTTSNFYGKIFRVVKVSPNCHFEMEPLPNGKGNRPVRGFYKIWLDLMMERFNFTVTIKLASLAGGTGKLFPNGTWKGAVADILYDDADMGVFVGHIYDRHPFVDWSAPLSYEWMVFVTHKPRTFYSSSALIRPFPVLIWLCFLFSVSLICICLKYISKYFPCTHFSYRTSIRYLLATFVEQSAANVLSILQLNPVRTLIAFWLLFALVLSTAYKGKLVSLIAFPLSTWVPETMVELAHSHYRVGVNVLGKGGASYTIFSTSKHPVYQSIFKRMEIYSKADNCLETGLDKDIGCIMWFSVAEYNLFKNFTDKHGRTPFQMSRQTTSFLEDGYIWEKRAIFRQRFDKITWAILERGLAMYWTYTDFNQVRKKSLDWRRLNPGKFSEDKENEGPSKLQLTHLTGLLYLFLLSHLFSFFTLAEELLECVFEQMRTTLGETLHQMKETLAGRHKVLVLGGFATNKF